MTDVRTLELARVIHIARLESCYIKGEALDREMARQPFPEVHTKEFRVLYHARQSWIDIAIDPAKAVQKYIQTCTGGSGR